MSFAISWVASGLAAANALAPIVARRLSSTMSLLTVEAIFLGLGPGYRPNPPSTTYGTLPASCPGKNDDKTIGKPRVMASAMVPGPALVTIQSLAPIYS